VAAAASAGIAPPPPPVSFDQSAITTDAPQASGQPAAASPKISISLDGPATDAARSALASGIGALRFYEAAALAGECEPLHQMRVTTRRLRAVVELFASVLHGSRLRFFRRDLPWVGRTAAVARECDVIEELIRDRSVKLDLSLGKSLSPIFEALSACRRAGHADVVRMIKSSRYQQLLERLAQPPVRRIPATVTVRVLAPTMVRPIARAAMRSGSRLSADSSDEAFHHLRIRLKRLRYALELLENLGGKRNRKALKRMRDLQDVLGIHQDAVCAIAWLRQFAVDGAFAPPVLLAAGALIQSLIERREKLAVRGYKRWKRFNRSGIMRDALTEIVRNARAQPQGQVQAVIER
jgi:CHAD domain-containing protein